MDILMSNELLAAIDEGTPVGIRVGSTRYVGMPLEFKDLGGSCVGIVLDTSFSLDGTFVGPSTEVSIVARKDKIGLLERSLPSRDRDQNEDPHAY